MRARSLFEPMMRGQVYSIMPTQPQIDMTQAPCYVSALASHTHTHTHADRLWEMLVR